MGYRMYFDSYSDRDFYDDMDNESPKFFGYEEGKNSKSYHILQEFAKDCRIENLDNDDENTNMWIFEDYQNMCMCNISDDFKLSSKDFEIFITQFLEDLEDAGYKVRESYKETIKDILNSGDDVVIYWC